MASNYNFRTQTSRSYAHVDPNQSGVELCKSHSSDQVGWVFPVISRDLFLRFKNSTHSTTNNKHLDLLPASRQFLLCRPFARKDVTNETCFVGRHLDEDFPSALRVDSCLHLMNISPSAPCRA